VTGTLPTANGGTNLTSFTSGGVVYASSTSALATGSGLTFDGTNLGLGVTPSAWNSSYRAFQVANHISLWGNSAGGGALFLANNEEFVGAGTRKYLVTDFATEYAQVSGQHQWKTAPSGTAGNAISFTQAMTLDASGNLGIGTTSPSVKLDVVGAINASGLISANNQLKVVNTTNDFGTIQLGTSSSYKFTGGATFSGFRFEVPAGTQYDFFVNGASKVLLNSFGVGLGGASPSSGAGITFPATQSASSNANTLDDYEEGTFTPTYLATTGTLGTVTYANVQGNYTKVGRLVTVSGGFYCSAFAAGTGSGDLLITGLPFASLGTGVQAISVGDSRLFTLNNPTGGQTVANDAKLTLFYRTTANGAINNLQVSDAATGSGALNLVYFTASYQI
jgi:hypothetical protein